MTIVNRSLLALLAILITTPLGAMESSAGSTTQQQTFPRLTMLAAAQTTTYLDQMLAEQLPDTLIGLVGTWKQLNALAVNDPQAVQAKSFLQHRTTCTQEQKNSLLSWASEHNLLFLVDLLVAGGASIINDYPTSHPRNKKQKPSILNNPLIIAARKGHQGIAQYLVQKGAGAHRLLVQDALVNATMYGHLPIVSYLADFLTFHKENFDSQMIYRQALAHGHTHIAEYALTRAACANQETSKKA